MRAKFCTFIALIILPGERNSILCSRARALVERKSVNFALACTAAIGTVYNERRDASYG